MKKFILNVFATLACCMSVLLFAETASNAAVVLVGVGADIEAVGGSCKTTILGCTKGTCTLANKCPAPNGECFCQ